MRAVLKSFLRERRLSVNGAALRLDINPSTLRAWLSGSTKTLSKQSEAQLVDRITLYIEETTAMEDAVYSSVVPIVSGIPIRVLVVAFSRILKDIGGFQ